MQGTFYVFRPDKTAEKVSVPSGQGVHLFLPADGTLPVGNAACMLLSAKIGMAFAQIALDDPATAQALISQANSAIAAGDAGAVVNMTSNSVITADSSESGA